MANDERPPLEICDECGFSADQWDERDTIKTVDHLGDMAHHAVAGLAPGLFNERPAEGVYSVAEYIDHMATVVEVNRGGMEFACASPGADLGDFDFAEAAQHRVIAVDEALERLDTQAATTAAFLRSMASAQWDDTLRVNGQIVPNSWAARHIVHDCFHHFHDIARIRHTLGDSVDMSGSVGQVSASGGGVPKTAVADAQVGLRGIEGDRQAARQHHGRPWQALCLFGAEVIADLQAEGHPIEAGSVGENLTLAGIDWSQLRSGLHLTIGEVECRLTLPAVPCSKNHRWFTEDSTRIDHDLHPGWARWYASVIQPGRVRPGDAVQVRSPH